MQTSEVGFLIRNAVALRNALKLGIRIALDEIRADEFLACELLVDYQERYEQEQMMADRKG